MKVLCQKCKSPNIYKQDGELCCMMCGKRTPITIAAPIIKTEKKEKKLMTRKKECRNCGRLMVIQQDYLCGGCHGSVKGIVKNSPEYLSALDEAKKRFTDPEYKRGRSKNIKNMEKAEPVKRAIGTVAINKDHEEYDIKKDFHRSPALDLLVFERDCLQNRVSKLNQVIDILRT